MATMMGDSTRTLSKGSIKFYGSRSLDFQDSLEKGVSNVSSQSHASTRLSYAGSTASSVGQTRYIENWLNQKSLRRIQEKHSIESLGCRQLYARVLKNEENFVHGIDEFLKETELLNLRRKELLYKEWHENVYEPTRRRIQKSVEAGFPILDKQKRIEYLKFLEYKDRKQDIFLDVISKAEYDPLYLHHSESPTNLKARTPRLLDPLLAQERQRIDEERTISRCETGEVLSDREIRHRWLPSLPLHPLGRHGTSTTTWLKMPLYQMESPLRQRSCKRMKSTSNVSNLEFGAQLDVDVERKLVLPPIDATPGEDPTDPLKKQVTFSLPETEDQSPLLKLTEAEVIIPNKEKPDEAGECMKD